ncbi:MAG: hypothetical protein ACE5FZ_07465 [Nitrospiria bacterium]
MEINLTEIQKKLNEASCPVCHNETIDVALRCDLGYGECLSTGTCRTCGTVYEVSNERRALEEKRKDLPAPVCPRCKASKDSEIDLEMRCELPSRQCFYIAHCRKCNHPFFPETVKGS